MAECCCDRISVAMAPGLNLAGGLQPNGVEHGAEQFQIAVRMMGAADAGPNRPSLCLVGSSLLSRIRLNM